MVESISPTIVSLAQHFMAGQIAAEATEEMIAKFKVPPSVGRVVIGTSAGDFHGQASGSLCV